MQVTMVAWRCTEIIQETSRLCLQSLDSRAKDLHRNDPRLSTTNHGCFQGEVDVLRRNHVADVVIGTSLVGLTRNLEYLHHLQLS